MSLPKDIPLESLLSAIDGSFGIVSRIADELNVSWPTAKKYIDMYDEAKEALNAETEKALDLAESCVLNQIQMDNSQDAKWYLSKKGKMRGYGDQIQVEHSGGVTVEQRPTRAIVEIIGND